VDTSGFAVGAVLLQKKEDGKRHPIAYFSKTLNEVQRNYDIADLELPAVVMSLDNWRSFLARSPHKVIVYSDHQNLLYWKEPHKISRCVAREVLCLSEYDIEIRHIKGMANGRADALSRRPDYNQGTEDNTNVTVLPEHLFVRTAVTVEPQHQQDKEVLKPWIDPHQLKRLDGVWYKEGRVVVTEGLQGKHKIIRANHDPPVHGHPGINRTTQIVEHNYWWPQLCPDVKDYVQGCANCQCHKVNNRPTKAPLRPIYPKPKAMPFETIALDFITKLPESQGYNSILTVTDHDCTKAALFIPCREEINAEGTAALYIQHMFAHFGLPQKVISDRDPRFVSKFMQEVCRITGIERNPSTVYHPRTDRQSERSNQWVETAIQFISDHHQTNWAPYLPIAQFAHNNWPSETTRKSPFFLLMGYHPRADWISSSSPLPQVTMHLEQLKQARDTAQQLMIKAQQSWVKHHDTPKYKEGDQVWLEGKNLHISQPTAKLAPRRYGPFKVIQVLSPVSYQLQLPMQWSIHPVFHIDLLTPYRETITHGPNYQRPSPDLVDGEEEYSVEKILDSRKFSRRQCLQYLVKWEGYPDSDNMWVDKDDVFADDKVWEFKAFNPAKEIHIRSLPSAKSPHPSALQHSHTPIPHAHQYMSSNGRSDLADETTAGAYADSASGHKDAVIRDISNDVRRMGEQCTILRAQATPFEPRPSSPTNTIADAFRQLTLADTAESHAASSSEHILMLSVPEAVIAGDVDSTRVALRTAVGSEEETRLEEPPSTTSRLAPSSPVSQSDIGFCAQCHGPREYCHGHESPAPTPVPAPVAPVPIPAPSSSTSAMAHFRLTREEAMSLADNIANALEVRRQDTPEVPPPYPEGAQAAEGMGIRRGRGQRGRPRQPIAVHYADQTTHPHHAQRGGQALRRPLSLSVQGYERNVGTSYIPFLILDETGRQVPARFIKVHMTDNPYVEARLAMDGPVHRGEIHAAAVTDRVAPRPTMGPDELRLLDQEYQDWMVVDNALTTIQD
jgi:hypothetical protein